MSGYETVLPVHEEELDIEPRGRVSAAQYEEEWPSGLLLGTCESREMFQSALLVRVYSGTETAGARSRAHVRRRDCCREVSLTCQQKPSISFFLVEMKYDMRDHGEHFFCRIRGGSTMQAGPHLPSDMPDKRYPLWWQLP